MILTLAPHEDVHARAVAQELEKLGHKPHWLDTSRLGEDTFILQSIGRQMQHAVWTADNYLDLDAVRAVWNRRTPRPRLSGVLDPEHRRFALSEWRDGVEGVLQSIRAPVVNPLEADRRAVKPRQLALAKRIGLSLPATLITNDPTQAERFVSEHAGRVIHKAMTAPAGRLLETRRWASREAAALSTLDVSPTILQEAIVGPADVRATVVGRRIWAARIETARGRADVDSRLDRDAPCEACELPRHVTRRLQTLVHRLGLMFATADFRITDHEDYVFLELNPQGQ